jgi:hypothetical protein
VVTAPALKNFCEHLGGYCIFDNEENLVTGWATPAGRGMDLLGG